MARNTRAAAHKGGPSLAARLPGGRCILPAAVRAVVSCALTAARADCLLRDRRSWAILDRYFVEEINFRSVSMSPRLGWKNRKIPLESELGNLITPTRGWVKFFEVT